MCKRLHGTLWIELQTEFVGTLIDVLLLQEHRLNGHRIASYGLILQGKWVTYY